MADVEDEYDYDEPSGKQIQLIDLDDLKNPAVVRMIQTDMERNLYASREWTLPFYLVMAWHGFIAVAFEPRDGPPLLLPEMQYRYAHLTLKDMHVSTKARKRSSKYRLRLNTDLDAVLAGVAASHDSWVLPKYVELLKILNRRPVKVPVEGGALLHVVSVELVDAESGTLVAGEVGYTIGAVYTSLTGFFDKATTTAPPADSLAAAGPPSAGATDATAAAGSSEGRIRHSSAGTVQLVGLGALLRRCGFAFWNLGHPPQRATKTREGRMWYKKELGARVYMRDKFLEAWGAARVAQPSRALHEALPAEGVVVRSLLDEVVLGKSGRESPLASSTTSSSAEQGGASSAPVDAT